MHITKTTEGIYKLTTNVTDILFEGLWDIPDGVSLNSFVVKGQKTAVIDGFCGWDGVPETFYNMLDEMDVAIETIDYIIINHMEPDHSGWMENLRALKEDVTIYCTAAAKKMLENFYGHTDNIETIKDGQELDLGDGRVLQFYTAPNVHWPDTMMTYDTKSGTLFSCDAFGSYGSIRYEGYDDLLTQEDIDFFEKEALRYYANIVASFSPFVTKAVKKAENLDIKIVAPGHGVVWRKDPMKIINDYVRYASYQTEAAKEKITLLWGTMYGMTEKGVDHMIKVLEGEDIEFEVLQVPETSWGFVLESVWESTGVIVAAPTYENHMFPPMTATLEEVGKKTARNRIALYTGSFGWGGGAHRELDRINEEQKMNWEILPRADYKGSPRAEDLENLTASVKELVTKVKEATK